jgi:glyoxylase-like metal-dependent hydrolase (beta-lactamase superfamily II)
MEQIRANIFVETVYPGINVGCIIIDHEAICVDTPLLPGEAQRWRARTRSLGAELVRFVVYTNGQQDRILGTQYLIREEQVTPVRQPAPTRQQASRSPLIPFAQTRTRDRPKPSKSVRRGTVVAHRLAFEQVKDYSNESFRQSMVETFGERDSDMGNLEVIPPQITFDEELQLYISDATVTLVAAAKGIAWVWLSDQRVLFVGDTIVVGEHPPLTIINTQEWLAALERLRQDAQFQDATIVPGRGPLCDVSATEPLTEYLQMACDKTRQVYRAGRHKSELNDVATELLSLFPVIDGHRERVQRQIKIGLDELYDGFKAADVGEA